MESYTSLEQTIQENYIDCINIILDIKINEYKKSKKEDDNSVDEFFFDYVNNLLYLCSKNEDAYNNIYNKMNNNNIDIYGNSKNNTSVLSSCDNSTKYSISYSLDNDSLSMSIFQYGKKYMESKIDPYNNNVLKTITIYQNNDKGKIRPGKYNNITKQEIKIYTNGVIENNVYDNNGVHNEYKQINNNQINKIQLKDLSCFIDNGIDFNTDKPNANIQQLMHNMFLSIEYEIIKQEQIQQQEKQQQYQQIKHTQSQYTQQKQMQNFQKEDWEISSDDEQSQQQEQIQQQLMQQQQYQQMQTTNLHDSPLPCLKLNEHLIQQQQYIQQQEQPQNFQQQEQKKKERKQLNPKANEFNQKQ